MEMKFTTIQYLPRTFVLLKQSFLDHKVRFHATVKQSTYPFLRQTYLLLSHLQGNVKIFRAPRKWVSGEFSVPYQEIKHVTKLGKFTVSCVAQNN